ncbi:ComF family protein [Weissella kandleri]|uniref:ComF family protein n=1 Tax=Weissella kandleri TaxID=1616 RepID=UPI00387E8B0F
MKCEYCQQQVAPDWNLVAFLMNSPQQLKSLCDHCLSRFQMISSATCFGCGRLNDGLCYDCMRWQRQGQPLLQNNALYEYNMMMKWYFQNYKVKGGYHLRQVFSEIFTAHIKSRLADKASCLVPIPVSKATLKQRGFNQVQGLLKNNLVFKDWLMCKRENKVTQSSLDRSQRMQGVSPFQLNASQEAVVNQHIVLIDDIYTTGRTLYWAADVFYSYGATSVTSITLAR